MDGNWRDEVLRLTEDRDRLIEEVKAAMRERDDAIECADQERQFCDTVIRERNIERDKQSEALHEVVSVCNALIEERDGLAEQVKALQRDFADAIEAVRVCKEERDAARTVARELRDLYAAEIDEGTKAFPLPWEVDDDTGRNGRRE